MSRVKILIADQDKELLEKAKTIIEDRKESYEVETVASAINALKKLEGTAYDVIISEYYFSEINGIEFLEILREEGKNTPFIIFTKTQENDILLKALNLGATRYIPKKDSENDLEKLANVIEELERNVEKGVPENELFQDLLERIPDTIYFKDKDARFIKVSKSKAEELGAEEKEIIGKTDLDFYPEKIAEEMYEDDMRVIENEEVIIDREEKVPSPKGEWWASTTKVPRYDENGNIVGMLGITRDITERKEAEQREDFLHTLLRHDLRNKISVVEGYLDLLKSSEISEEQKNYIKKALKAIKDSSDLVEKVRALREVREEETKKVSLDRIIRDVISDEKPQAEKADIEMEYNECGCKVLAGALLEELFYNLIENSIQHAAGCEKIRISTKEGDEKVKVTVEDDGCGIPDNIKEEIFEKGFKEGKNAGSGLGMHLVKRIAENYGGEIAAKDSDLGGAKFEISLKKV